MTSARISNRVAGHDVVAASEELMDGLLGQEERCFQRMADGLAVIARELEDRLVARERQQGTRAVFTGVQGLLPAPARFEELLLPAVGDLLSTVRARTLATVAAQLRTVESSLAREWSGTAARAVAGARQQAARLETHWYGRVEVGLARSVSSTREVLVDQAQVWWSRKEPIGQLVRRWCSVDEVYLTGSRTRGAVWLVRSSMAAEARNSGVALVNGLTMAGMTAWNDALATPA